MCPAMSLIILSYPIQRKNAGLKRIPFPFISQVFTGIPSGWPTLQNGLEDLITQGADYLVFANPTPDNYKLGEPYRIVTEKKEYVIFDLHAKR